MSDLHQSRPFTDYVVDRLRITDYDNCSTKSSGKRFPCSLSRLLVTGDSWNILVVGKRVYEQPNSQLHCQFLFVTLYSWCVLSPRDFHLTSSTSEGTQLVKRGPMVDCRSCVPITTYYCSYLRLSIYSRLKTHLFSGPLKEWSNGGQWVFYKNNER